MSDLKETAENVLKRVSSPWFFTFIPWWIVLNYDFLILVFGEKETLTSISTFYCTSKNLVYTVGGCFSPEWQWWMEPLCRKLLWPLLMTVLSLLIFQYGISWIEDKYNSIKEKDFWWRMRINTMVKKYRNRMTEKNDMIRKFIEQNKFYGKLLYNPKDSLYNSLTKNVDILIKYIDNYQFTITRQTLTQEQRNYYLNTICVMLTTPTDPSGYKKSVNDFIANYYTNNSYIHNGSIKNDVIELVQKDRNKTDAPIMQFEKCLYISNIINSIINDETDLKTKYEALKTQYAPKH